MSACLLPSPRHASRLKHCYRACLQTSVHKKYNMSIVLPSSCGLSTSFLAASMTATIFLAVSMTALLQSRLLRVSAVGFDCVYIGVCCMCLQCEVKKKSIASSVLAVGLQVLLWLQVILSVFRGFKCLSGSREEGADASILPLSHLWRRLFHSRPRLPGVPAPGSEAYLRGDPLPGEVGHVGVRVGAPSRSGGRRRPTCGAARNRLGL